MTLFLASLVGTTNVVVVHRKRKFNEISGISGAIGCGGHAADMNKSVALPRGGTITALNQSSYTDQKGRQSANTCLDGLSASFGMMRLEGSECSAIKPRSVTFELGNGKNARIEDLNVSRMTIEQLRELITDVIPSIPFEHELRR